jgi:hypothetical protein
MDDFACEVQCDELAYEPTTSDWLEYQEWLDTQEGEWPQMLVDEAEFYSA